MSNDLFTVRDGQGPPVVLVLHGLGVDHTLLRSTHRPFGIPARMVYFDLIGCGRSPDPEDWSTVTHATFVENIDEIRRNEGVEKVFLLAHSYGCALALEYALAHGDRVAGLILCGGG